VVDDEEQILDLLKLFLTEFNNNYNILFSTTGEEAIKLAKNCHTIDFLITDIRLESYSYPNGFKLSNEIKIIHPRLKVLYISGYLENGNNRLINKNNFLQKPFLMSDFINKVNEILNES
jgi:DNA-binding NtrC family response regulator